MGSAFRWLNVYLVSGENRTIVAKHGVVVEAFSKATVSVGPGREAQFELEWLDRGGTKRRLPPLEPPPEVSFDSKAMRASVNVRRPVMTESFLSGAPVDDRPYRMDVKFTCIVDITSDVELSISILSYADLDIRFLKTCKQAALPLQPPQEAVDVFTPVIMAAAVLLSMLASFVWKYINSDRKTPNGVPSMTESSTAE